MPEFDTFVPDSYDLGVIELDTPLQLPNHKRPQMDHPKSKYKNKELASELGDQITKSVESKNNRLLRINSRKFFDVETTTKIISEQQATIYLWGSESDVKKLTENEDQVNTVVNLEEESSENELTTVLTIENEETTKDLKQEKEYKITHPDSNDNILLASKPDDIKLKNIH